MTRAGSSTFAEDGALASPATTEPASRQPGGRSLLGRATELAELADLLERHRIVTVTGAPGIGKTRLACELMAGYRHSAHVVELACVARPTHLPRALGSAMSVEEIPDQKLTDTIVARIGARQLLVVFDNCEHVLGACAKLVATLLSGCPELRILATSREPLGLAAERVWQLGPLAVPDPDTDEDLEPLGAFAAVDLFVERAAAVQPGFALNAYLAPDVAEICRRLDGTPLAIELAASRVETLTPSEIASHLDDRFTLLTQGGHDALPRHRTLEAALEWSHDLLSASERALLRRLSVFVGGFEIDAAVAICSGEQVELKPEAGLETVPDLLARLVSKSLVGTETAPSRETRYRLLETIRAYAGARLQEAGEAARLRQAHASYYLGLAERAEPEITGPGHGPWLERLAAEHANLRSALEWQLSHGEPEWALRLAGALVLFWRVRGHYGEGREMLQAALSAGEEAPPDLRAKALWGAGLMALMGGDIEGAVPPLEESVALCDRTGDRQVRARALLSLGDCGQYRGDPETLSLLEESAASAREVGDGWCLAHALGVAGFVHEYESDLTAARSRFEECLAVARGIEDPQSLRYGLIGMGLICFRQGDYRSAEPLLEEAVAVTTELGEDYGKAMALQYLGRLALGRGDYPRAREQFEATLALMPELGPPEAHFPPLVYLSQVAFAEADYPLARRLLDKALALIPRGADTPGAVLRGMADLAVAEGDLTEARRLLEHALASSTGPEGGAARAGALCGLGNLAGAEGDIKQAMRLHREALDIRRHVGDLEAIVASLEEVAGLDPSGFGLELSARLLGAVQSLRDANGYGRSPAESLRHERNLGLLRERLGAKGLAAAVAEGAALSIDQAVTEALTRRDRRGRPTSGWESLTEREHQVAELAAEGCTNPEIAGRLFITRETVKRHLSNAFSKLGVTRRGELAHEVWRRNGDSG